MAVQFPSSPTPIDSAPAPSGPAMKPKAGRANEVTGAGMGQADALETTGQLPQASVTKVPEHYRGIDPTNPPTNPAQAAALAPVVGGWHTKGAVLVTASSVEAAVQANPALLSGSAIEALSKDGPLGAAGPLSAYGAIGRQPWNPSFWMQKVGDWSKLSETLTENGGPGSAQGPLGDSGPLQHIDRADPALQAGGALTALGPLGPLGALGALGYLGQIGGHGLAQNDDGEFLAPDGGVQRTTTVKTADGERSYELFEFYGADHAKAMTDNDTSFMVRGKLETGASETFPFRSNDDQLVTLAVVPERLDDTFQIELVDAEGQVAARSDSQKYVNWIQLQVPKNEGLTARVTKVETTDDSPHTTGRAVQAWLTPLVLTFGMMAPLLGGTDDASTKDGYRMYVVGSTHDAVETAVAGAHQSAVDGQG